MPYFDWNEAKNELLKAGRGIGFEDVLAAIDDDRVLDDIPHPKERYRHQRVYIVDINNYAYLVPYIVDGEKIFLKTIIPNRKATKQYLRGKRKEGRQ